MRVARQSWPDAAAGALAYARLSSHESQAHSPGGTLAPLAARHPTGPLRAGLEELRARSLADALAGVGARLGPRDAAGLGAARPGGVARGARRAGERVDGAGGARGGQPGSDRGPQVGRDPGRPGAVVWRAALEERVSECTSRPVLVGHSLGAIAIVKWAAIRRGRAAGAFLVAPADVEAFACPSELRPFAPIPRRPRRRVPCAPPRVPGLPPPCPSPPLPPRPGAGLFLPGCRGPGATTIRM